MNAFKKDNFNTILIVILIVMNLASLYFMFNHQGVFFNKPFPKHDEKKQEQSVKFLKKELKLTKSQVKEFNKLKKELRHHSKGNKDQIRQLQKSLFSNIGNEDYNVERTVESISQNHKELEMITYNHFSALRDICNENQKKKFDKIILKIIREMMSHQNGRAPRKKPL